MSYSYSLPYHTYLLLAYLQSLTYLLYLSLNYSLIYLFIYLRIVYIHI